MFWSEGAKQVIRQMFSEVDIASSTWGRLGAHLERAMKRGAMRKADPWTAAQHFRGLLEADIIDRAFFGFPTEIDEALVRKQSAKP